jgi:hypothetical protein
MKPQEFVNYLRRIATAIEKSKNPDKNAVIRDLKIAVARILPISETGVPVSNTELCECGEELDKVGRCPECDAPEPYSQMDYYDECAAAGWKVGQ